MTENNDKNLMVELELDISFLFLLLKLVLFCGKVQNQTEHKLTPVCFLGASKIKSMG